MMKNIRCSVEWHRVHSFVFLNFQEELAAFISRVLQERKEKFSGTFGGELESQLMYIEVN